MRQYKPTKAAPSLYEYRAKRAVRAQPDMIEFEDVITVVTMISDTDQYLIECGACWTERVDYNFQEESSNE